MMKKSIHVHVLPLCYHLLNYNYVTCFFFSKTGHNLQIHLVKALQTVQKHTCTRNFNLLSMTCTVFPQSASSLVLRHARVDFTT